MVVGLIFELTGTVSPASAWQIDEIVLPIGPEGIKVAGGINKEVMAKSGDEPTIIVDGSSGTTLTLQGTIADDSKSDVALWADLLTPLLELRGTEITLVCPLVGLNGVYLLESFEPSRNKYPAIYDYSMRLTKSSLTVIMTREDSMQ